MTAKLSDFVRRFIATRSPHSPCPASAQARYQLGAAVTEVLEPRLMLTSVPGETINTAVTWTAASSPYTLSGNVTVAAGGSLTIQSGVTVNVPGGSGAQLIVASGGSISASNVHFALGFSADQGASGSVTNSFFDSGEFSATPV